MVDEVPGNLKVEFLPTMEVSPSSTLLVCLLLHHLLLVGAHQGNLGQLLQHLLLDNLDNLVSFSLPCQTFQRPTL